MVHFKGMYSISKCANPMAVVVFILIKSNIGILKHASTEHSPHSFPPLGEISMLKLVPSQRTNVHASNQRYVYTLYSTKEHKTQLH